MFFFFSEALFWKCPRARVVMVTSQAEANQVSSVGRWVMPSLKGHQRPQADILPTPTGLMDAESFF